MNILVINETLNLGGAENMVVTLSNAVHESAGMNVSVASSSGELLDRLSDGIDFREIPRYAMWNSLSIINSLADVIEEKKPEIIHSHSATLGVLAGIAAKRVSSRAKRVLTHHSRNFSRLPQRVATVLLNKYFDRVIAISDSKCKELISSGVDEGKVKCIPNFVDCGSISGADKVRSSKMIREEIGVTEETRVIMGGGNLRPGKGFDRFVDIVKLCVRSGEEPVKGVIVGDGEMLEDLKARAGVHEGSQDILFMGYKRNMVDYLAASDIFLFPSEHEVLPMALIEASACGVPIVCSDIKGNNDIVRDLKNGFLVSGDDEEYYKKISAILGDRELARSMSEEGIRMSVENFDKNIVVDKIKEVYMSAVKNEVV